MAPPLAFTAFYSRNADAVLIFFLRRTFDAETALDLTAETFAQAWSAWDRVRLDHDAEAQGWLYTIARRQLSRYQRHGRVEQRAFLRLGLTRPELADDQIAEIERYAELGQLRSVLSTELEKLPAEQRLAVQLRIVDELPYSTLAQRLGTTEATARARVSRGLRALAGALEQDPSVARSI